MKKIIFGIVIGILVSGGIVYAAVTYKASDISYESSDASWEVSNVEEAINSLNDTLNDLQYNQQNNTKKALVFTSSPVDMTQYTDRWSELTTSDFKVGVSKIKINYSSSGGDEYGSDGTTTETPTFKYDSTTGKLTFNQLSWNRSYCANANYNTTAYTNGNGTTFVVWLGTVGGN